jgi:hypothetical protein
VKSVFTLVLKRGARTLHEIRGAREVDVETFSLADVKALLEAEGTLERLLGLRAHLEHAPSGGIAGALIRYAQEDREDQTGEPGKEDPA